MNETKHTPGPWKVIDVPNGDGIGIIPAKRPKGVKPRDVEDIASISKSNDQYDPFANARLIAAAPDLLAACQAVMEFLSNGTPVSPGALVQAEVFNAIRKATNA